VSLLKDKRQKIKDKRQKIKDKREIKSKFKMQIQNAN